MPCLRLPALTRANVINAHDATMPRTAIVTHVRQRRRTIVRRPPDAANAVDLPLRALSARSATADKHERRLTAHQERAKPIDPMAARRQRC